MEESEYPIIWEWAEVIAPRHHHHHHHHIAGRRRRFDLYIAPSSTSARSTKDIFCKAGERVSLWIEAPKPLFSSSGWSWSWSRYQAAAAAAAAWRWCCNKFSSCITQQPASEQQPTTTTTDWGRRRQDRWILKTLVVQQVNGNRTRIDSRVLGAARYRRLVYVTNYHTANREEAVQ